MMVMGLKRFTKAVPVNTGVNDVLEGELGLTLARVGGWSGPGAKV